MPTWDKTANIKVTDNKLLSKELQSKTNDVNV